MLAELVSKLGYRLNKCESSWLTCFILMATNMLVAASSCIAWQWTRCITFWYCSTFCFQLQSCYHSCKSITCDIHLRFDARLCKLPQSLKRPQWSLIVQMKPWVWFGLNPRLWRNVISTTQKINACVPSFSLLPRWCPAARLNSNRKSMGRRKHWKASI